MSDDKVYKDGDVVWVKLGSSWWPSEVTGAQRQPEGLLKHLKWKPYCVVKFFSEDTYEYVKTAKQIFPYQCSKKNEFIKKGTALYSAKNKFMEKFPGDVEIAERLARKALETDMLIINDRPDSIVKAILGQSLARSSNYYDNDCTTNNGNVGYRRDSVTRILDITPNRTKAATNSSGTNAFNSNFRLHTNAAPTSSVCSTPGGSNSGYSSAYSCNICNFTSVRQNVMILHRKSHNGANATSHATPSPPASATITSKSAITANVTRVMPPSSTFTKVNSAPSKTSSSSSSSPARKAGEQQTPVTSRRGRGDKAVAAQKISYRRNATERNILNSPSPGIKSTLLEKERIGSPFASTAPLRLPSPAAPTTQLMDNVSATPELPTTTARLPKKKELASLKLSQRPTLRSSPQMVADIAEITLPSTTKTRRTSAATPTPMPTSTTDPTVATDEDTSDMSSSKTEVTIVSVATSSARVETPKRNTEEIRQSLLADWSDEEKEDDEEAATNAVEDSLKEITTTATVTEIQTPSPINELNKKIAEEDHSVVSSYAPLSISIPLTAATAASTSNRIRNIPKKDRRDIVLKEFINEFSSSAAAAAAAAGAMSNNSPSSASTTPPIVSIDSNSSSSDSVVVVAEISASTPAASATNSAELNEINPDDTQKDSTAEIPPPLLAAPETAAISNTETAKNTDATEAIGSPEATTAIVAVAATTTTTTVLSCFDFQEDEENDDDVLTSIANFKKKYFSPDKSSVNVVTDNEELQSEDANKTTELKVCAHPQDNLGEKDQQLAAEIDSLLEQTTGTVDGMSAMAADSATNPATSFANTPKLFKEDLSVRGLPIKERGKRIFKSRNRSRMEEQVASLSATRDASESGDGNPKQTEQESTKKNESECSKLTLEEAADTGIDVAPPVEATIEFTQTTPIEIVGVESPQADVPVQTIMESPQSAATVDAALESHQSVAIENAALESPEAAEIGDVALESPQLAPIEDAILESPQSAPIEDATLESPQSAELLHAAYESTQASSPSTAAAEFTTLVQPDLEPDPELDHPSPVEPVSEQSEVEHEKSASLDAVEDQEPTLEQLLETCEPQLEKECSEAVANGDDNRDMVDNHSEALPETEPPYHKTAEEEEEDAILEAVGLEAIACRASETDYSEHHLHVNNVHCLTKIENDETIPVIRHSPVEIFRRESLEAVQQKGEEEEDDDRTNDAQAELTERPLSVPITDQCIVAEDSLNGLKDSLEANMLSLSNEQDSVENHSRFTSPTDESSSVAISEAGAEFGSPTSLLDEERMPLVVNNSITPTEINKEEDSMPAESQLEVPDDKDNDKVHEAADLELGKELLQPMHEEAEEIASPLIEASSPERQITEPDIATKETFQDLEKEARVEHAVESAVMAPTPMVEIPLENNFPGAFEDPEEDEEEEIESPPHEELSGNEFELEFERVRKSRAIKAKETSPKRKIDPTPPAIMHKEEKECSELPEVWLEKSSEKKRGRRNKAGSADKTKSTNNLAEEASPEKRVTRGSLQNNHKSYAEDSLSDVMENTYVKKESTKIKETPSRRSHRKTLSPSVEKEEISKKQKIDRVDDKERTAGRQTGYGEMNPTNFTLSPTMEPDPLDTTAELAFKELSPKTGRKRRSHMKITPRRRPSEFTVSKELLKNALDDSGGGEFKPKTRRVDTTSSDDSSTTTTTTTTTTTSATTMEVSAKRKPKTKVKSPKLPPTSSTDEDQPIVTLALKKEEKGKEADVKRRQTSLQMKAAAAKLNTTEVPPKLNSSGGQHTPPRKTVSEPKIDLTPAEDATTSVPAALELMLSPETGLYAVEETKTTPPTPSTPPTGSMSEMRSFRPRRKTISKEANIAELDNKMAQDAGAVNTVHEYQGAASAAANSKGSSSTTSPIEKVRINVDVANPLSSQIANILATNNSQLQLATSFAAKKRLELKSNLPPLKRKNSLEDDIPSFIIERPGAAQTAAEEAEKNAVAHVQNMCPQVKITRKEIIDPELANASVAASQEEDSDMFDIDTMPMLLANEQILADSVQLVITPVGATAGVDPSATTSHSQTLSLPLSPNLLNQEFLPCKPVQQQHPQRQRKSSSSTQGSTKRAPRYMVETDEVSKLEKLDQQQLTPHQKQLQEKQQMLQLQKLQQQLQQQHQQQHRVNKKQIGIDARGNKYVIIKTPPADLLMQQPPLHHLQQHNVSPQAKAQSASFNIGSSVTVHPISEPKATSPTTLSPPAPQQQQKSPTTKPKSPAAAATGGRKQAGNTIMLPSSITVKQKQQKFVDEMADAASGKRTGNSFNQMLTSSSTGGKSESNRRKQQHNPHHQLQSMHKQSSTTERGSVGDLNSISRRLSSADSTPSPAKIPKTSTSSAITGEDVALAQQQFLQLHQQSRRKAGTPPPPSAPPPLHPLHNRKPRHQPQQHRKLSQHSKSPIADGTAQLQAPQQLDTIAAPATQTQQQFAHSTTFNEDQLAQIQTEEQNIDGSAKILAVPTQPIPGYTETFLLCTLVNNNYKPMDNVPLYLDHDLNQLVPVPMEALDGQPDLIVSNPVAEDPTNNQLQTQQQQVPSNAVKAVEHDYSSQLLCLQQPVDEDAATSGDSAAPLAEEAAADSDGASVQIADFIPSDGGGAEAVADNAIILNIEGQQIIIDAATFAHLLANPDANTQLITDEGTEFVLTREVLTALEAQQRAHNAEVAEQQLHQQLQVAAANAQQLPNVSGPHTDILAVALAGSDLYGSDVLEIETSQGLQLMGGDVVGGGIVFQPPGLSQPHLTPPITAHTSETNALLNQTPIMSTLEKPLSALGKRKQTELVAGLAASGSRVSATALLDASIAAELAVCRPNLEDSLAVIGVTAPSSSVPISLELPITVTNPVLAPKVTMATMPTDMVQFQPHRSVMSAETRLYSDLDS